jgi:hypothetical protein
VDDVGGSQPCIARIGNDGNRHSVWVAYPSLNSSKKQTYVIAAVTFGGSSQPFVDLVANVTAEDPTNASAIMGAFVYDDLIDPADNNQTPTVLCYWIDAPTERTANNGLLARYQLFYSGGSFPAGYLSVSGGHKRTFSRVGIGDYFSGGYFWLNNRLNFLCQWNEPDGIKANIVSMEPIRKRRDFSEVAIDPLALILSNKIYVLLTLPDPPPPDLLRKQIEARLRGMSIAQRNATQTSLKQMQQYLNAIERELK